MSTTIEITGYGQRALDGAPFRVAQTGERIGRKVPTVAARAVALVQEGDWSALRKLWRRSNLRLSTGCAHGELSVGYGSARLVTIRDERFWMGLGAARALALLEVPS